MSFPLRNRIPALLSRHRGNVRKLAFVMGSAVLSRAAQVGLVVVVARQLGPTDFGAFVFAIGASIVAGMLGGMGLPLSFNRYFALIRTEGDHGRLRGLMRASTWLVIAGGAIAAVTMAAASWFVATLGQSLLAAALLTVPYGVTMLRRQQLAGTGQAPFAMLLDQGLAAMVLFGAVLFLRLSLIEMLAIYMAAMVAGNVIATYLINRKLPPETAEATPEYQLREWLTSGISLLVGQSARLLLTRLDVLLVPALAGLTQAGLYGAALRVTYLLTFPQFILQTITAPQFADAFANKQIRRARLILAASLIFALATTLPLLAFIALEPAWVMTTLFGREFASGASALVLVSIGQVAISIGMPFGNVLAMSGRERAFGALNGLVLAACIAVAFFMIPREGALGGGIAMAVSGLMLLAGQIALSLRPLGFTGAKLQEPEAGATP